MIMQRGAHVGKAATSLLLSCRPTCGQGGYITSTNSVVPKARRKTQWLHNTFPFSSPQDENKIKVWTKWQIAQIALALLVVRKRATKSRQGGKEKGYGMHGFPGAHPGKVVVQSLLSWGLTSRQCSYITSAMSAVARAPTKPCCYKTHTLYGVPKAQKISKWRLVP